MEIESNNCIIIHCLKENNDKHTVGNKVRLIALSDHALRAQNTDID